MRERWIVTCHGRHGVQSCSVQSLPAGCNLSRKHLFLPTSLSLSPIGQPVINLSSFLSFSSFIPTLEVASYTQANIADMEGGAVSVINLL